MGFSSRIGAEEGESLSVSQRSYSDSFLGSTQNNQHRLFSKGQNNQWRSLRQLIIPIQRRSEEKTSALSQKENIFSPRKLKVIYVSCHCNEICESYYKSWHSSNFSGCSSQVTTLKKELHWKWLGSNNVIMAQTEEVKKS